MPPCDADAGPTGIPLPGTRAIYRNTSGGFAWIPGANVPVADDLYLEAISGCGATRIEFGVWGGGDGSGPGFSVAYKLFSVCPGSGSSQANGTIIAGSVALPNDGVHLASIDLADTPIPLPPSVWLQLTFDSSTAGWLVGSPSSVGYSTNRFDTPSLACNTVLPDPAKYGAFNAAVYAADSCAAAHLSFLTTNPTATGVNFGANVMAADDITLDGPACLMTGMSVTVRGAGLYRFDLRTVAAGDGPLGVPGDVIAGTTSSRPFPTTRTGPQLVPFSFDPPIPVPRRFWATYKPNNPNAKILQSAIPADVGATENLYAVLDPNTNQWVTHSGEPNYGSFDFSFSCAGAAQSGACCVTESGSNACCREASPSECSTLHGRWRAAESCDPDPFDPPCGVAACCLDGASCENLTPAECAARNGTLSPAAFCDECGEPCVTDGACGAAGTSSCLVPSPRLSCRESETACASDRDCPAGESCRPAPGCADCVCCRRVCAADPSCCRDSWSQKCADTAAQVCEPTNDDCVNAFELRFDQPVAERTVDLRRATWAPDEGTFCCGPNASSEQSSPPATVWFRFTATAESAHLSTCGGPASYGDSLLEVFAVDDPSTPTTRCATRRTIGCMDDAAFAPSCDADEPAAADMCVGGLTVGAEYLVKLGAKREQDRQRYTLALEMPCADAPLPNGRCETAEVIAHMPFATTLDLGYAVPDCAQTPCSSDDSPSVWFEWTAPVCGEIFARACSGVDRTAPVTVAMFEGCGCPPDAEATAVCAPADCLQYSPGASLGLTRPQTCYRIRLSGAGFGAPNPVTLTLNVDPNKCDDCNANGVPDANERSDCNNNRFLDACEVLLGLTDCDANDVPDECQTRREPDDDCDESGTLDICDIAEDLLTDCDGDLVPDICNLTNGSERDCNQNGVPDSCDLFAGTSLDDDGDDMPNECEPDCQPNGVRDDFDLASESSMDCNGDGRPDECGALHNCGPVRLGASLPLGYGEFGYAIAIDGDWIVAGAPSHRYGTNDDPGDEVGAVYLFHREFGEWVRQARWTAPDAKLGDRFGQAVALDGDFAAVGAPNADCNVGADCGAVYVYQRFGPYWSFRQRVTSTSPAAGAHFGNSVSMSGNALAVGARGTPAAVVFRRDGFQWIEDARLSPSTETEDWVVSIRGNLLAVAAAGADAYLYHFDGAAWNLEHTIPLTGGYGGVPVALAEDFAVVVTTSRSLSVLRRTAGAWAEEQSMAVPLPGYADHEEDGLTLTTDGRSFVLGTPRVMGGGAAWVYSLDAARWTVTTMFQGSRMNPQARSLGHSVALRDGHLGLGGPYYSSVAFTVDLNGPDCDADGVSDACEIAANVEYDCDGNGIPDTCPCGLDNAEPIVANAIPSGCAADCQTNHMPDFLDIATGTSHDCDRNSIPDECGLYALGFSEERLRYGSETPIPFTRAQSIATGGANYFARLAMVVGTAKGPRILKTYGEHGIIADAYGPDPFTEAVERVVVLDDLDGDRDQDIVFSQDQYDEGGVYIWFNERYDGVSPHIRFRAEVLRLGDDLPARGLALIDIDHDGDQDIEASFGSALDPNASGRIGIFVNDGAGHFRLHSDHEVGRQPQSVTLFDADGDGNIDILTPNLGSNDLSVLLNHGFAADGTWLGFHSEQRIALPQGDVDPWWTAADDFDRDGYADAAIVVGGHPGKLVVLRNRGVDFQGAWRGFQPPESWPVGHSPTTLAVYDLNDDRWPDIVVGNTGEATLSVLGNQRKDGSGHWRGFAVTTADTGVAPAGLHRADLDVDGRQNLIVANRGVNPDGVEIAPSSVSVLHQTRLTSIDEPFTEELDPLKWSATPGVYWFPLSYPSGGPVARVPAGDQLESATLDLSRSGAAELRFSLTRDVPHDGVHSFRVAYWDGAEWTNLLDVPHLPYFYDLGIYDARIKLPPEAHHDRVRIRFSAISDSIPVNGYWDIADIELTSVPSDCDNDGALDGCQIADQPSLDRNANRRPDVCDFDFDADHDVDLRDIQHSFACFSGSFALSAGPCAAVDFHQNGKIDLADHAVLADLLAGPLR